MELKQFIQTSIVEIVGAVEAAQAEVEGKATLNPYRLRDGQAYTNEFRDGALPKVDTLNFDVAVTAEEGGVSGKAGIRVAGVSIGGEVDVPASSQVTSRIQFSLDVVLPSSEAPAPRVAYRRATEH